jgi:hypothetical protein
MELDISETAVAGAPDTIRRLQRIQELRRQSLALSPDEWEASRDISDGV